jgi:3,4-dihydroxy-2-butanone 4-phosphate synthase
MAATLVNPESIAFLIRIGSGIISVGMKEEDLTRLMIPMMSPITEIEDISAAASTVTVVNICHSIAFAKLDKTRIQNFLFNCTKREAFFKKIPFRMPELVFLLASPLQIEQKPSLLWPPLIPSLVISDDQATYSPLSTGTEVC